MSPFSAISGRFATIVADPPWSYQRSGRGAASNHYSTENGDFIRDLPVSDLAADNAHLYMWVTTPKLWDSPSPAEICEAWGFTYKTMLTWVKGERVGLGWYYRVDTEHCVFATRGKAPIPPAIRASNVLWSPRTSHSAKPPAFYDLVEAVSPGPRIELFARNPRLGWGSWGKGYETAQEVLPL